MALLNFVALRNEASFQLTLKQGLKTRRHVVSTFVMDIVGTAHWPIIPELRPKFSGTKSKIDCQDVILFSALTLIFHTETDSEAEAFFLKSMVVRKTWLSMIFVKQSKMSNFTRDRYLCYQNTSKQENLRVLSRKASYRRTWLWWGSHFDLSISWIWN